MTTALQTDMSTLAHCSQLENEYCNDSVARKQLIFFAQDFSEPYRNQMEKLMKSRRTSRNADTLKVCHIARDIELTGGGEVVKQVARHMATQNIVVAVITDTAKVDLGPLVRMHRTMFGAALLDWVPSSRVGWHIRHILQILVFTITSTFVAIPMRMKGFVIFNHNCESLIGQILVMHNVFTAELSRRNLSAPKRVRALLSPVRTLRIIKETILSLPTLKKPLVSVSEQAMSDILFLNVAPERIVTIANGVDIYKYAETPTIEPPQMVSKWAGTKIQTVVLFVGHEWKKKGLDELLEAMTLLPPSYGLIVVGGASQNVEVYQRKNQKLGLNNRVLFAGTWADIRGFLAASHVFCLPSHAETMPLVALEALAAGVPIVLTKECPASQLITAQQNGSVTTHDPHEIASKIIETSQLGRTPKASEAIRKSVADHNWDLVGEKYINLAKAYAGRKTNKFERTGSIAASEEAGTEQGE